MAQRKMEVSKMEKMLAAARGPMKHKGSAKPYKATEKQTWT
jgi:hypothetical protein